MQLFCKVYELTETERSALKQRSFALNQLECEHKEILSFARPSVPLINQDQPTLGENIWCTLLMKIMTDDCT